MVGYGLVYFKGISTPYRLFHAEFWYRWSVDDYIYSSSYTYLLIIIFLHICIWYQISLYNINKLHTIILSGIFNSIKTLVGYWILRSNLPFANVWL